VEPGHRRLLLAGFYPCLARESDPRFSALSRAQAKGDTRSCELIFARSRGSCGSSSDGSYSS
jgi:hypothetical protein